MKKVTLLFPSKNALLLFQKSTHANYIAVDEEKNTLICECSQTDIRLAVKDYNAKIVESCND